MIVFTNMDVVGPYLPHCFSHDDPRPAARQVHTAYKHGGGWQPFTGFKLIKKLDRYRLVYPGDPDMMELSRATLRDETIVFFQMSWLAIIQPDETYEVARVN